MGEDNEAGQSKGLNNLESTILKAAVGQAVCLGDYGRIERVAKLRERFGGKKVRNLLSQILFMRTTGDLLDDILTKLTFGGLQDEFEILDGLTKEGKLVSEGTWRDLLEQLNRPWAVARLGRLAQLAKEERQTVKEIAGSLENLRSALLEELGTNGNHVHEVHRAYPAEPPAESPPAFVSDLLMHGYVNASGPPKTSFKTLFGVALSLSIHTGREFLGKPVKQAPTAWIQLDMAEADFQRYVERIGRGMGYPEAHLPYMFSGKIDLAKKEQWGSLFSTLKGLETKVLFIDSSRAASSTAENESDEVRELVRQLFCAHLRDELGITTVLITHSTKLTGGTRGSGEWTAAADSEWRFDPQPSGYVKLKGIGRHPAFQLAFKLEDSGEDLAIKAISEDEERQEAAFTSKQLELAYSLVSKNPDGLSVNELQAALKEAGVGVRKAALRAFQDRLVALHQDCALREERSPAGGKYPKRVIFLVGSQEEISIRERKDLS